MTLHEWGLFHKSDKATAHGYLDFYEARIGEPKSIMEFGILNGASLKMWRDRYNAKVFGIDINLPSPIDRVTMWKGDCTNTRWKVISPTFDLIIDDASHVVEDMIAAFNLWCEKVNVGGCYILEDIHTMHYKEYNPSGIDLKKWIEGLGISHEYFRRLPDESDSMTVIFYK